MSYKQLIVVLMLGIGLGAGVSTVLAQDETNSRPETVVREGLAPTRQAPNGKAQVTLFAEGDKAFFGKLRVEAGASVPEHQDESEEYLYVVKGKGTLTIDGTDYKLKPNTGVYMPAGSTVKFENGDQIFEAIQFFAPADSANKYTKWETGKVQMQAGEESGSKSKSEGRGQGP